MTSPPSKRQCCEHLLAKDSESDDTDLIFPSDDEDEIDGVNFDVFYPSEDSNQPTEQDRVVDAEYTTCATISDDTFVYPSEESNQLATEVVSNASLSLLDSRLDCTLTETSTEHQELEKIGKLLIGICCDKECLRNLTANDIITARTDFVQLTISQRKQYLFTKLRENSCNRQAGKVETKFYVAGKEVCSVSWADVYSISKRTLVRMMKDISFGENCVAHGNQGRKRVNTKKESVAAWMERYFNLIGDKMPDSKQIHLPSWETQKDIHLRYCQDMQLCGIEQEEISGISTFYKIWSEQFPHVVIPEQNRFAKCDICVKIKLERKSCLDKNKQSELKECLHSHLERVDYDITRADRRVQSLNFVPHYLINEVPKVDDNFHVECIIGSGSFGTVYAAVLKQNPVNQMRYALKHIISTCFPAKVENEIKCLAMMKDVEHIISIETFFRYNVHLVLVMPFFEHDAFTDYFSKMTIAEVQHYIKGLFICLEVVHSHEIIHRDIKPSNFLYNYRDKTFKLIDFGLAHFQHGYNRPQNSESLFAKHKQFYGLTKRKKNLGALNGNICNHGTSKICDICCSRPKQHAPRAGTSGFRAPEVLIQYEYQTTAVDVWSAGVILLSLLSGKYPFFKPFDDMTAMMQISLLFGSQQCKEASKHIGKELHFLPYNHAKNLVEVCSHLKRTVLLSSNVCIDSHTSSQGYMRSNNTSERIWTTAPSAAYDLLQKCLELNPLLRILAKEVLNHSFLQNTE